MPVKKTESQEEPVVAGSVFDTLSVINVNDHTEEKNGLTYLSWAWAWAEVKKAYPKAFFTIYERETEYGPVNYFTDGKTCWVKTGLTIEGLEHIEELPVMDFKNNSIPLAQITSTAVNKAIQRSLTKAAARHGLGLYIYAGEDLPEDPAGTKAPEPVKQTEKKPQKTEVPAETPSAEAETPPADENLLPLDQVIKELDVKIQAIAKKMTKERKQDLASWLKKELDVVDYRKCTNVAALNKVLKELSAA